MNFGQAKESRFVEVFINGEKDLTRDVMLEDLEPGKLKEHKFSCASMPGQDRGGHHREGTPRGAR